MYCRYILWKCFLLSLEIKFHLKSFSLNNVRTSILLLSSSIRVDILEHRHTNTFLSYWTAHNKQRRSVQVFFDSVNYLRNGRLDIFSEMELITKIKLWGRGSIARIVNCILVRNLNIYLVVRVRIEKEFKSVLGKNK